MTVNKRRIEGTPSSTTESRVWPTGTDYSRAIQAPAMSFTDSELAAGTPGINALGMPLVASGQNAVVFLLESGGRRSAVRCFLTPPSEGAYRYAALENHLVDTTPRALTSARWLNEGILVGEHRWPVVVMPWVEGTPLNIAVEDMLDDPSRLRTLALQWAEVVRSLQRAGVAHGDLQHGNVLIRANDSIALVDLDGVWVPEIEIGPPAEFGHPNYQHPQRNVEHWGRYVDSFPGALIELALNGLAADASLERHLHGENLLFMRADLERPQESEVWGSLCASPDTEVARLAAALRQRCAGPIEDVLIPFEELRSAAADTSAPTVLRRHAALAEHTRLDPSVEAQPAAWWEQDVPAATSVVNAIDKVAVHILDRSSVSASSAAAPSRVSPLVWFGRNSMIAGLTAGALAGVLGSLSTSLVDTSLGERGETIAFVAFIGILLGGLLLSLQSIVGGNWRAAARRFLIGAVVGGGASLLALPLADAAVRATATEGECSRCTNPPLEVPFIANVLIFVVVGCFIGFALGMLRSVKSAFGGFVAGGIGGVVGGAIFGATVAEYDDRAELNVYFLNPVTILVVAVVAGSIGLAFGAMLRIRRTATLTIIEGRNSGLEIAVEGRQATIGSAPNCDVVLSGDSSVVAHHVMLDLTVVPASLVLAGPTSLNGVAVAGEVTVASGDVLLVGGSFIRIEFKDGRS